MTSVKVSLDGYNPWEPIPFPNVLRVEGGL